MAAHTVAVGHEQDSVAVEHPVRHHVKVTAVGDVHRLALAVGIHDGDVGIRVVAIADDFEREPFAVGRPFIVESSAVPERAVGYLAHGLAFRIVDHQFRVVLDIGDFLAVGREFRNFAVDAVGREEGRFFNQRSIREVEVVVAENFCHIKVPCTVAFAGVDKRAVVRAEVNAGFCFRSVGNLFRCSVFHRSDKHVAADHERNLFAIRRYGRACCAACIGEGYRNVFIVGHHIDFYHFRCTSIGLCVDGAVVGEAELAVFSYGEEAYRVSGECRNGCCLFRSIQRE